MMQARLYEHESPVAVRQPKTDRLILARLVDGICKNNLIADETIQAAHAIIRRWADAESSGRLDELTESQLQGDFLAEVFGDALGYRRAIENEPTWSLEQHLSIGDETPDAVLGKFQQGEPNCPLVIVELKGPNIHLDRHRSQGRTAVDQCWDYLNNTPPTCRWGIVSNMVSFRLYERDSTKRAYEHFTLQSLRKFDEFRRFYMLFRPEGLIGGPPPHRLPPETTRLVNETRNRQREVGDKLYETYSENRVQLIAELHFKKKHTLDASIEMAQRLLDRIVFIAFCEDRKLLPERMIESAWKVAGITTVTNPKWQSFKSLFQFVDQGSDKYDIPRYNGGLFQTHPVDKLELNDEPWTEFFRTIGSYDFADEINLDVLGHLFERSITELEKLKLHGLFGGDQEKAEQYATMPQSVKRKQLGIYYTPAELTSRIVQYTVTELIDERFIALAIEHGIKPAQARRGIAPDDKAFWQGCLEILRNLKIVDPACGSGAFLFQAYNVLEHRYLEVIGNLENAGDGDAEELAEQVPHFILNDNLYGVDLSPEAVEITQLAMWIRSASRGQLLANLSQNIVHGNSLVHDPAVHPAGFDWRERFAEVFDRPEAGFDCVIGNPPWERMDLSEREFFSLPAPEIATATTGAKRAKLIAKLETNNPLLHKKFIQARDSIDSQRDYCHTSKRYPLTGKGRTNLYAVFSELAFNIVAPHGRVGLLTPSGIASDKTTMDFFAAIAETNRLIRLYDFENKKVFFPDVHASFKFCILNFGGLAVEHDAADFIFFVHSVDELDDRKRHIELSGADIKLLNPNTRTCPIFRTRRDAEITKAVYRRVPILVDHGRKGLTGNPWGIRFKQGLFNQTSDSRLFEEADALKTDGCKLKGNQWTKGKAVFLPLYEAKMFRPYDHRHGTVYEDTKNWINQGQTFESTLVQHQNPEYLVQPRWWVNASDAREALGDGVPPALLAFRDITRATDSRTFIAAAIPFSGVINTAPFMLFENISPRRQMCLLANWNSFALDFVAKCKTGHIHMNFFIVEQLPTLPPDTYDKPCPWAPKSKLEKWISERVLKLTCTAEDMLPLAEACSFTGGSFKKEYGGRLNKWDESERAVLMAELDAAYFHLYGIDRDDAEYILSTFKGIHEPNPNLPNRASTAEFILEKFDQFSAGD